MVKANELRVGNLVLVDKMIVSILEISQDEIWCKQFKQTTKSGIILCHLSELKPIKLIKKWLIIAGFKKIFPKGTCYMYNDFSVYNYGRLGIYFFNKTLKIESLHKLQNLYYALNNEELVFSSTEP